MKSSIANLENPHTVVFRTLPLVIRVIELVVVGLHTSLVTDLAFS